MSLFSLPAGRRFLWDMIFEPESFLISDVDL